MPSERSWRQSRGEASTIGITSPLYGFAPEVAAMMAPPSEPSSSVVSAERQPQPSTAALQALDARLDQALTTRTAAATGALQEQRRMLDEVRDRLEETRRRIAAATATSRAETLRGTPALTTPHDALTRDFRFASRVDILAHTLNSIAERTMSLSSAIESLRASSPRPSRRLETDSFTSPSSLRPISSTFPPTPRSPPTPARRTSFHPDPPPEEDPAHTDEVRAIMRQLVLMSRRVSAVIAQHREQVGTTSANLPPPSASPPPRPTSSSHGPSMREQLPVILPSYLHERPLPPDTTPNLDGLLLPQSIVLGTSATGQAPVLSTSPQPLSSPSSPPLPDGSGPESDGPEGPGEAYPGERAQLLRIAQLQSDIAARAAQLRALRQRGRDLGSSVRDRQASRNDDEAARAPTYSRGDVVQGADMEGDKDEDGEAPRDRRLAGAEFDIPPRPLAPPPPRRGDLAPLHRRSEVHGRSAQALRAGTTSHSAASGIGPAVDAVRRKQEYEIWRRCGR